ncbi:MAG TPA: hypothetical protein VD969_01620 [Symbiobacteriaceae bacterium]|nr:hypothetical protein [Symbiobacteriaceae bacterium]
MMPRSVKYENLKPEDFDALVTGELTHYASWLEDELNDIITSFFVVPGRSSAFKRLLLYRDGLTFQDKIETVRGMIPELGDKAGTNALKSMLKEIEEFKASRNAMAHGLDASDNSSRLIRKVEIINRAGKPNIIEISPQAHRRTIAKVESLLTRVQEVRKVLIGG